MSDVVPPRPDLATEPSLPEGPGASRRGGRGSTWTWYEAVGVYLGCLFVTSLLAIPIIDAIPNKDDAEFVASAVAAIGNVLLLVLWLSRAHPGWRRMIGFPTRLWPEVRAGVGFGLLLYPGIAFGIGLVVALLLSTISGKTVTAPEQVPNDLTTLGSVTTAVYAILIAPIHEELFFRGILFRTLRDRYGFGIGATFSGIAFGAIHYTGTGSLLSNLVLMLTMVFTGFALAYLYERRSNIVAPMFAHATFNAIGIVLIYFVR
jgi:membrane protease YdiL (CAAX protease family)